MVFKGDGRRKIYKCGRVLESTRDRCLGSRGEEEEIA
jgi:hypothetical protein